METVCLPAGKRDLTVWFINCLRLARDHLQMLRLLFFFSLIFVTTAYAGDHDSVQKAVEAGKIRPLSEILMKVQAQYAGKVTDVDLEHTQAGTLVYEIKLSNPGGERRTVYVDAATGVIVDNPKRLSASVQLFKPLDEIVNEVLQRYPGYVIELELERGRNQQDFYEIKILQHSGHIIEIHVDVVSGKEITSDLLQGEGMKHVRALTELLKPIATRYGGIIKEVELERESDQSLVYKFEIRRPDGGVMEVDVDAVTGKVLRESGTKY